MSYAVSIVLALVLASGLFYTQQDRREAEKPEVEKVDNSTVPSGTPGQSAPQVAVAACVSKEPNTTCSFTLADREMVGICIPSGDELACTPILPE